mgnify:CR=1 FL=1
MNRTVFVALAAGALASSSASAFEFRTRFVRRMGNIDTPTTDQLHLTSGEVARVRIQFGVFDSASGPAPEGGFIGWNVGTLAVSGLSEFSDAYRTPGRLAPFNFATGPNSNGNPPAPAGDPFITLTDIDSTLGTQSPIWTGCDADGNPTPQPAPVIRGLNTFVSVYEITVVGHVQYMDFTVNLGGNAIAAQNWREVGTPIPPNCDDPQNPEPGFVTYGPFPLAPVAVSNSLFVHIEDVPGAGSAVTLLAGLSLLSRRHRTTR